MQRASPDAGPGRYRRLATCGEPASVRSGAPVATLGPMSTQQDVLEAAGRAREASHALALATRAHKDRALHAMADALGAAQDDLLAANAEDVARAEAGGTPPNIVDRLRLTPDRLAAMAQGLRDVAALPDPVGEVVRGGTLANGLELRQVRVPFGVVGMIYEARPNVTADAAGICLKSGNAVLLRGSSSARSSNAAIVAVLRDAAASVGLDPDVVQLVPGDSHEAVKVLMRARGLVDVLIPRGGAGLIRSVVEESTVPVIETGVGNCHVYVDRAADQDKALAIVLNAKTHRTSVCNAAESLLVHADVADAFLPRVVAALQEAGVTIHGDDAFAAYDGVVAATDDGLRRGVPLARHLRGGRGRPRRGDRPHPAPLQPALRRDRDRGPATPPAGSWPRSTPRPCWSTRPPGSPTAASSASAPRSGSAPRSCTPAGRWDCRR